MDADSYFMVLSNVLRGQDWKGSIDQFCETHMELFDFDGEEDDEFGHGHFAIWEEYRILAEEILESLLGELGGSIGALEKQIDRRLQQAPRGHCAARGHC